MNTPQTDTPRTDFEESIQTQRFGAYMVKANFARTLERENAAMREAIREVFYSFADDPPSDASWLLDDRQNHAISKLYPFTTP